MSASAVERHAEVQRRFKNRLQAKERLLGTFLKTATPHATEILGDVGFDFVIADAEHAPFGRTDIDNLMLAARAADLASLVRVPSRDPAHMLSALDCGAAGVLIPHILDAEMLGEAIGACRYRGGSRGFSNSPRAGGYGRLGFTDHIAQADSAVSVLAMIEDPAAIDRLDEILRVDGLSGIVIGRGDLSATLGAPSTGDPAIAKLVEQIAEAARRHGVAMMAHIGSLADADRPWLEELGITAFLLSSDQGLMRQAALAARRGFDENPGK